METFQNGSHTAQTLFTWKEYTRVDVSSLDWVGIRVTFCALSDAVVGFSVAPVLFALRVGGRFWPVSITPIEST